MGRGPGGFRVLDGCEELKNVEDGFTAVSSAARRARAIKAPSNPALDVVGDSLPLRFHGEKVRMPRVLPARCPVFRRELARDPRRDESILESGTKAHGAAHATLVDAHRHEGN